MPLTSLIEKPKSGCSAPGAVSQLLNWGEFPCLAGYALAEAVQYMVSLSAAKPYCGPVLNFLFVKHAGPFLQSCSLARHPQPVRFPPDAVFCLCCCWTSRGFWRVIFSSTWGCSESLKGTPAFQYVDCSPPFSIIHKLAEGACLILGKVTLLRTAVRFSIILRKWKALDSSYLL